MGKEDYKNEKKGHGFLCVPKELLFDNRYKQLTIEAILLYAYMLDRLKLSIENGWKDSDGKVFIYFSLESIMDLLKCSKGKAISTLKELDENRYCDCHFIYGGIWNSKIFSKTWIDYVESFSSDIYVSTDFACDSILYGHGKAWLGKHKNRTYYCVSII